MIREVTWKPVLLPSKLRCPTLEKGIPTPEVGLCVQCVHASGDMVIMSTRSRPCHPDMGRLLQCAIRLNIKYTCMTPEVNGTACRTHTTHTTQCNFLQFPSMWFLFKSRVPIPVSNHANTCFFQAPRFGATGDLKSKPLVEMPFLLLLQMNSRILPMFTII